MRLRAWQLVIFSLILVIGSVSLTHFSLIRTTTSPMEYQGSAGRLLEVGGWTRTWLISPLLLCAAVVAWIRIRHRALRWATVAFAILWAQEAGLEFFRLLVRRGFFQSTYRTLEWRIFVWSACLILAFGLLAYGLAAATSDLSKWISSARPASSPKRQAFQVYLWHFAVVVLVITPFLTIARVVIPALQMSVKEFFYWNWYYLVLTAIYLVITLLVLRSWERSKSLAILSFAIGLGLQFVWYLLKMSIGGDKLANLPPESPFFDFLLPLGPASFWVPVVGDVLFFVGICLLYVELSAAPQNKGSEMRRSN